MSETTETTTAPATETTKAPARRRTTTEPAGKVRTGDPQTDRAVRNAAARPAPKASAKAEANGSGRASSYRAHATNPAPDAMVKFTKWILRECPEFAAFGKLDRALVERFVTVASKDYRAFQSSDLNR
jgi:hypothetical protein